MGSRNDLHLRNVLGSMNYTHIAYYNDWEDIIDLFPNMSLKGDEADIVVNYMKDGYGHLYTVDFGITVEPFENFGQDFEKGCALFTKDRKYLVIFSDGSKELLMKKDDQIDHGYYIDIWQAI